MKYTNHLENLGLTVDQAKVYEILISTNVLPVKTIAQKSSVGRELTYIVLKQLEELGLVEKSSQGKILLYKAKNPRNIKKLADDIQEKADIAKQSYNVSILEMVNLFSKNHNKPYIRFYEGLEGLQKTYDHLLRHTKTVHVFRSLFDYENLEIRSMITNQLKKQSEKKIRSYVLSPYLEHMSSEKLTHSLEKNVTRKIIPKDQFSLPAQIIIYNDTVSITTVEKEIVTTIIENKEIAQTFLILFQYIWNSIEV